MDHQNLSICIFPTVLNVLLLSSYHRVDVTRDKRCFNVDLILD